MTDILDLKMQCADCQFLGNDNLACPLLRGIPWITHDDAKHEACWPMKMVHLLQEELFRKEMFQPTIIQHVCISNPKTEVTDD